MGAHIEYFKTFDFKKREEDERFDFETSDGGYDEWRTSDCVKLIDGMYKIELDEVYEVAFPYLFMEDRYYMSEKDIEELKSKLIKPSEAISLFETHNILEKVKEHAPEIVYYIEYLLSKWKEGYHVLMFR